MLAPTADIAAVHIASYKARQVIQFDGDDPLPSPTEEPPQANDMNWARESAIEVAWRRHFPQLINTNTAHDCQTTASMMLSAPIPAALRVSPGAGRSERASETENGMLPRYDATS